MEQVKKHIVNKVMVEFHTSDEETAFHIKNHVSSFLERELFPVLEEYLEMISQKVSNKHLQIPSLKIDLKSQKDLIDSFGKTKNKLVLDHLLNQFKVQLEQQLKQLESKVVEMEAQEGAVPKSIIDQSLTESERLNLDSSTSREINTIIYVLQNGRLPWWIGENEKTNFFKGWDNLKDIKYLLEEPIFRKYLIELAGQKEVLARFIKQFSDAQLSILFMELANTTNGLKQSKIYKSWIKSVPENKLKNEFWTLNWKLLSNKSYKTEFITQVNSFWQKAVQNDPYNFQKIQILLNEMHQFAKDFHGEKYQSVEDSFSVFNQKLSLLGKDGKWKKATISKNDQTALLDAWKTKDSTIEEPQKEINDDHQDEETSILDEGILVSQAGLVLIHSFVKPFFKNVGLIGEDNRLKDKNTAVHLLHFLATKEEEAFDHELLFEKYCCNIPFDQPLERNVVLPDDMKEAAEELLSDVLGHWKALKSTSADTLRSEFLCRRGKISLQGNHHKMVVERKAQDILLDQVPWSISLVKFPWRKELLFVEW
ncbi:contractile injection system tape measure protein [Algoriphagus machipongonensis]|uniref:Uncharacterized protein n=1 Tax=Algoriphagus machipongonensis TaxID=388413 RepID=A3HTB1_9BACT|nr:contractile injection system tape measure protein [Algoriphagus machipongonensis]EAZ83079.2 hypothetical protein ALPR1_12700 [Algoriphagus machipongonensis]